MKTTKYLSLAALALMGTLASCQSDDELTIARPDNAVGINVTVGSLQGITRSNPAATDPDEAKNFNQGDRVCVSTDGQDPVLFQCQNKNDQTWAEAEAGKFLLWTASEMTFKAYYPATTGTSMTAFTLPADQSTEANIALADYMTRQQTCTNVSGNNINLDLERKTARVIVNIAGFNDQYDNDHKTVSNVRIYSEASGIEDGNPTGSSTEIQPYAPGNGGQGSTYTALVVPGSGDNGADFITLTDALNNTLTVKGIPELEAGNSYTFNLTVGKNTIQVQSVTVQDWATGETLAGGQAQEQGSASVPITVTWNNNDITGTFGDSFTKDGVTITVGGAIDFDEKNFLGGGTFTTTLGNFTKIEVTTASFDASGTGWSGSTWTGNASSVSFDGKIYGYGDGNTKFVFTIEQGSGLTYPIALSEVTADYVGSVVCSDGNVYPAKTAAPAGKTAVGILGKVTTTGQGLILALKDAKSQTWNTINSWTSVNSYAGTTLKVLPDDAARGANLTSYTTLGETTVSNWAVAQKDDYDAIFQNLGSTVGDDDGTTYDGNVNAFITGVGGTAISEEYWSATEATEYGNYAWFFNIENWSPSTKQVDISVRPVLGFGGNAEEQGGGQTYPIALSAVTADYVSRGSVVCSDGNVYSAKEAVPAGKTAVGILGKVTETGHGLILALQDATSQDWNTINGWTSETTYAGTTLKVLPDDDARGTNLTSYTTLGTTAVSNWAVAQKSDYVAIFENLGSTTGDSDGTTYDFNVNDYIAIFVGGTALSDFGNYWSATVGYDDAAWFCQSNNWSLSPKTNSLSVRPVLAF